MNEQEIGEGIKKRKREGREGERDENRNGVIINSIRKLYVNFGGK